MKLWPSALVVLCLAGCSNSGPVSQTTAPVDVQVPAGTEIPLVLIKNLRAGEAREGDLVPFLVSDDVQVAGKIVVAKGTTVTGKVTWSRSEGTLSGLMNQPARLEVAFNDLALSSGRLAVVPNLDDPEHAYAFTRENTSQESPSDPMLDELVADEAKKQVAEKLNQMFDGKEVTLDSSDSRKALKDIVDSMGMGETQKLLQGPDSNLNQLQSTVGRLQRGDLSAIAKGDLSLSLNSVLELANLAGGLGDRLARSLKGRTIHALAGTRLTLKVKKATILKVS